MKPFSLYILRCRDNSLYIGHTDDLDLRMDQHDQGVTGSYAGRKGASELVWVDEFPFREEALARELQIKKWTRKKKEALIAGDWDRVKALARCRSQHPRSD